MDLEKQEIKLSTGDKVFYEYDTEGDILEIVFCDGEATAAIELTESIILRFDWEKNEPLSLSFISFSQLMQPAEYGMLHFQLLTDQWPSEIQSNILMMLKNKPLTEFLTLGSYMAVDTQSIIPQTTINYPTLAPLVV